MDNNIAITTRALGTTSRRPDVTFYRSGRIDITARVAKLLGLQSGDVIDVAVSGREYYLYIRSKGVDIKGRHEAQCFPTNKGRNRHNFRTYSKSITNMILAISGGDEAQITAGEYKEYDNIGKSVNIIPQYNLCKQ